ncbi:Scr1 family TA system antitoxin-like transcriptional regulator [Actinophytocola glycyrrhizae]|uniref:Scr1 family TA system antitoxin-like transcriptional regulator n=1 Tax=Actinophytocola glycyrrhizae TaxID=2044873 RepID=A0ABV9SA14_9PSEU
MVKELIAARQSVGMNASRLAAEIDLKPSAVSKIEKGTQGLTVRNIKAYARVTGLSKTKTDELLLLAANDDTYDDWLVEFRADMPDWFALYPELEQDAVQIWTYSSELVEGLFQTPDYAEAIVRAGLPDISSEELERSVQLRTRRQLLLGKAHPPTLRLVLNEAVVRRQVGGEAVMAEQIRHLLELSEREHISIQVLPFSAGAHPGMKTGFTLLRFPEGFDDMDCVYLENNNGGVWQEVLEHVAEYSATFERQRSMALSPQETSALLASLIQNLRER